MDNFIPIRNGLLEHIHLRASGYMNYRPGDGQRGLYPILLNKYEPTVGGCAAST